jgi:hypothetical protein
VFAITDQNSFWDLDFKTKDPSEDLQSRTKGLTRWYERCSFAGS